jgi:ATP-binding cassette, subfamily C (CFTR/MRP), member 1
MMKSLLYASLGNFFNRVPLGRIISRLTKDLRELDEIIGTRVANLLVCFFRLLGNLTICVYSSTPLILLPMVLVALIAHKVRNYYMKSQIEVARYEKSTNSPIVSGFISTVAGLSSIRAYRMTHQFMDRQAKNLDRNKRVRLTRTGMESWFSINLSYLSFFINMGSIGYCLLSGNTNASLAGLLMNYAVNLSGDIILFTNSVTVFESKLVSLERVYSFMHIEPEAPYLNYCAHWDPQEEGFQQVIQHGAIQFRALSARYRPDLPDALKKISINIRPGEKIGIVGRTGAGKTTIINTLLRLTELSEGELLIDDTPIQNYLVKHLRNSMTMIDQDPTLIKSSFKENLDLTGKYSAD